MAWIHTAHLVIRPEYVEQFRRRIRRHAETSLSVEPGCLVFRTLQDRHEPTRFMMYEVYADEAADRAHRSSAHFAELRRDIDAWVTSREWWFWEEFPDTGAGSADAGPGEP